MTAIKCEMGKIAGTSVTVRKIAETKEEKIGEEDGGKLSRDALR